MHATRAQHQKIALTQNAYHYVSHRKLQVICNNQDSSRVVSRLSNSRIPERKSRAILLPERSSACQIRRIS